MVLLALLMPPATTLAVDAGGGCEGEGSTPGIVVTAVNTITGANVPPRTPHDDHNGNLGPQPVPLRFTLTAHTNKAGIPLANIRFPQGIAGVDDADLLVGFEIHRLFIKDESHEAITASLAEGDCDVPDDGCDDEHGAMIGVGIRGLGTLADGTRVRVHIDLQDRGPAQDVDRFRIRWRENTDHDGHGEGASLIASAEDEGGCPGGAGWLFNSGWVTVKRVDIHQR